MSSVSAALAAAFFMPAALACVPHDQMATFLQAEHGEALVGWGADPRGLLLELYSDPRDGSWTVTLTGPDGQACIVSWGEAWQDERGWPA